MDVEIITIGLLHKLTVFVLVRKYQNVVWRMENMKLIVHYVMDFGNQRMPDEPAIGATICGNHAQR